MIEIKNLKDELEDLEYKCITDAMALCLNNQSEAARRLGISRTALRYKLARYAEQEAEYERIKDGN